MPVILLRAMGPGSVVDDADEAELLRRLPPRHGGLTSTHAGHSIQGDQPLELAALLNRLFVLASTDVARVAKAWRASCTE